MSKNLSKISKTGKRKVSLKEKTRGFKKILVTGGAGYGGSALGPIFLKSGYGVRVLDMLRSGGQGLLPCFGGGDFEFIKGDVRDRKTVEGAMKDVDAVVHLAAVVGFPACRKDPKLSHSINVDGTKVLVDAARGKVPVLFASTGSTYGKMLEKYCTELTALNPLSDYAKQKVEAERLIKKNGEFVIFRFATAFGVSPRMRFDLLPNDFTYRAVHEKSLIVYERQFMRTFIHVRDMGLAFLFALQNYGRMRGEIYNVGSNDMNYSKEAICELIKKKVDYYIHFADFGHDLDQRDYIVSYDKLHNLGFYPGISMKDGIDELISVAQLIEISNPYFNA